MPAPSPYRHPNGRTAAQPAVAGFLIVVACLAGFSCTAPNPASERAAAVAAADTLVVAAPWPWARRTAMLYREGLQLAAAEINAAGGVTGRPVRVQFVDDGGSVDRSRLAAQTLSDDRRVAAVIGHLHSYTTLPAAAIYERGGLLLLAPSATAPALTTRGYRRVFRTTPSNAAIGTHLARTAARQGLQRVLLCYVDSDYGRALANAFERQGREHSVGVVLRQSYSADRSGAPARFQELVQSWRDYAYDAVVLIADLPSAALLVAQARSDGVDVPILGGDAMAVPALISVGGAAVEGVQVPTRFLPEQTAPAARRFTHRFTARYGVRPDLGAAAAYDALHLWAAAASRTGTATPDSVAAVLRRMPPYAGATGPLAFDDHGNLTTHPLQTAYVRDGAFHLRSPSTETERGPGDGTRGDTPDSTRHSPARPVADARR